jgi:tetratricopeptide (TPR) repeat protein
VIKGKLWLGLSLRRNLGYKGDRFFINKSTKHLPNDVMSAAINNFNQNLKSQSEGDVAKVWYEKGEQLANLGKYVEALNYFNQAVAIQSENNAAWVMRGVVLIHLNRYEEALVSCEKALQIQPNDKQAWLFRGAALNHLGRYKQSYGSYDKALGIERQSPGQKLSQTLKGIFRLGNTSDATLVNS